MFFAVLLFSAAFGHCYGDKGFAMEDLVHELPGVEGALSSRWFSGFVDTSIESKPFNELHYHYILIEAENNPSDTPLVIWTNGGPGASSLWGLLTEIGPYYLSEDSLKTEHYKNSKVPTLFPSDTSWTKFANLLILSGPPPVSFGYCDKGGISGDGYSCGSWTDEEKAEADFGFVEGFLKKFPIFLERKSDLFITGESYGGIYIPLLTQKIRSSQDSKAKELLKGIAIGDGCVGNNLICSAATGISNLVEQKFSAQFLFGHGQIPTQMYKEYVQACEGEFEAYDKHIDEFMASLDVSNFESFNRLERSLLYEDSLSSLASDKCERMYQKIRDTVGFFNPYGLYDECWENPDLPGPEQSLADQELGGRKYQPYPCGGQTALQAWVKSKAVKRALHVQEDSFFFSGDNGAGMEYISTIKNLLPWHKKIAADADLKVLIYNGDTDHDLNAFFSEWWINKLGIEKVEEWRPWTLDGKKEVVGYTMRFKNQYDYVTIRGSGHMVPTMKPRQAYELVSRWIKNEQLQRYTP